MIMEIGKKGLGNITSCKNIYHCIKQILTFRTVYPFILYLRRYNTPNPLFNVFYGYGLRNEMFFNNVGHLTNHRYTFITLEGFGYFKFSGFNFNHPT